MELTIKGETNEIADLMVAIQGNRNYNLKTPNFSSNTHPLTVIDEIKPYRRINISENLRRLREKAGLSQGELAKSLGVSKSIISQYESNSKIPSLPIAKQIADKLGCKLDDFFGNERKAG